MKNIFILILVCVIKLSAYEYLFFDNYNDSVSYTSKYRWFTDSEGNLEVKIENMDGSITYGSVRYAYFRLIRRNDNHYIRNSDFQNLYKGDLNFLNDLYKQCTNQFLNYLYSDTNFDDSDHIQYNNYELLYNSDGLAVESIVDGVWAGLYEDDQKGVSGALYNSSGTMVYYNGEPVNWFQSSLYHFTDIVKDKISEMFNILSRPILIVVSVVFVFAILYFVVRIGINAIKPYKSKPLSNTARNRLFEPQGKEY